ncbi:MAG: EAL domain-containing protein [Lachnospiraceae bacterium]|nr:EAL domain-containing protein [Lachnospiraceae bacterium]
MRTQYSFIFAIMAVACGICAVMAAGSRKPIRKAVTFLLAMLIPPVLGNLIIISSVDRMTATVGYYIYFLGMDAVIFALLYFTMQYCNITWKNKFLQIGVYLLLIADVVQYALNPFFGQAFSTEEILVDDEVYFKLIAYNGQAFHRMLDYGIFLFVLMVFFIKTMHSPKIYSERFSVIFISMSAVGLWETFYIASGTPVDRSMIGFGAFGILAFYFSIHYRPMRLLDSMLANLAADMQEGLFFFDVTGQCIWANDSGIKLADIKDENFAVAAAYLEETFGTIDLQGSEWSRKKEIQDAEGETKYFVLEKHAVIDDHQRTVGCFISAEDHTRQELELQRERYNATHDQLTGLYNREYLYEKTEKLMDTHPDTEYLIVYSDVSEFKMINEVYGMDFGDKVLRSIAERIGQAMSKHGVAGRLVGDTFGVCVPATEFDTQVMERELSRFEVEDGENTHSILVHMGVYRAVETGIDVSVMFDRARIAFSTVKDEYQVHIAWYNDEMRKKALWSQQISAELGRALREGQILPYFQAVVDGSGKVVGAEALVRWIHPEKGFLSPGLFIPVLEKNGMIAQVDLYMWRCACETLAKWKKEGRQQFISVNISPRDFYFMDVVDEIKNLVKEFDVEPKNLRIEITESVMMSDAARRIAILEEFRLAGFIVEMDDFGSGYSSFNMLKDMPIDVLKIDMMFLQNAEDDERTSIILQHIIKMSQDLGITALTEGVELEEQYRMLADMGCKLFQGYHFAKPMPLADFEKL